MQKLDNSRWPLLLVAMSPIVVAPVTVGIILALPDCGLDEPAWRLHHMRLALLPGLVNIRALSWLASSNAPVRHAAVVATLIGLAAARIVPMGDRGIGKIPDGISEGRWMTWTATRMQNSRVANAEEPASSRRAPSEGAEGAGS